MRIEDNQGRVIATLEDWANLHASKKWQSDWKGHRSMYSMADFFINLGGTETIQSRISTILGQRVNLNKAIPDYVVRYDEYGSRHVHDLGIFGQTDSGKSLFIGVDARINEPFGQLDVLRALYKAGQKKDKKKSQNASERIKDLITLHFPAKDLLYADIRYQLLCASAGTIAADADISILYVIVFKTSHYDERRGAKNFDDYLQFVDAVNGKRLSACNKKFTAHELDIGGRKLICAYEHFEFGGKKTQLETLDHRVLTSKEFKQTMTEMCEVDQDTMGSLTIHQGIHPIMGELLIISGRGRDALLIRVSPDN